MDANLRRDIVLTKINSHTPISASALAKELDVSRQVIVGDVALLRASGHDIIATARGYVIPEFRGLNQYVGKIPCRHNTQDTAQELYTIVDLGATIVNVIVEHELYGEMTGQLNIKTREDVAAFVKRVAAAEVKLLSELSGGIHLHTIACRDKPHFEQVYRALGDAGFLVS